MEEREYSQRTVFTRKCIAESIVDLMKKKPYEKITVSEVVRRAGVARMTFYNYYHTTYDALRDYLEIIIGEYLEESKKHPEIGGNRSYSHILFSLKFYEQYEDFLCTMAQHHLHSILLDGINGFMLKHSRVRTDHSVYEMYCYSGGLLNVFLTWIQGGKSETAEEIADIIYKLFRGI